MADYNQLKTTIAEVIKANGNEEITGDVLQYILLQMVIALGKDFQFAGVGKPHTDPLVESRDERVAWILGAGHYENFGEPFDIAVNEIGIITLDGTWHLERITTGAIVDDEITPDGQNPVKGSAIAQEFAELRAAGYLFAGLATVNSEPPAQLTEKIFYIATEAGAYPNFDAVVVQQGISILKWNGSQWNVTTVWRVDNAPTVGSDALVKSGGVKAELDGKVDKIDGKGLSEADFTNLEKMKVDNLPSAAELTEILGLKQDVLSFDNEPTEGSLNPVTSNGIHQSIKDFVTKVVDDLVNYYTKSQVYTKEEIEALLAGVSHIEMIPVQELPEASAQTMGNIYLVPSEHGDTMEEWITLRSTEGGIISYYWQQIGSTNVDLSNYPTFDDLAAAIATALEGYYTKTDTDALIGEAKGQLADVSLSADKDVILKNTSTEVTLTASTDISAESLVITRGGVEKASGSGKVIIATETVLESGDLEYLLTAVIGGVTRYEPLTIKAVGAVYYGAGTTAADITTKASARKSQVGRYQMVAEAGDKLFVLVPEGMTVNGMRMNGVDVPLETATGIEIDGAVYLCYQSSNAYDAGVYEIEVY